MYLDVTVSTVLYRVSRSRTVEESTFFTLCPSAHRSFIFHGGQGRSHTAQHTGAQMRLHRAPQNGKERFTEVDGECPHPRTVLYYTVRSKERFTDGRSCFGEVLCCFWRVYGYHSTTVLLLAGEVPYRGFVTRRLKPPHGFSGDGMYSRRVYSLSVYTTTVDDNQNCLS